MVHFLEHDGIVVEFVAVLFGTAVVEYVGHVARVGLVEFVGVALDGVVDIQ